ncbi:ATP-binding cassette domain-containing protein [Saccharomonospora sp. NPDC046836]|uniref:ABC transporter ATP-binding protein n=1 Tax=Saccharomonospora sp. NPDC046836 TaxID=3156921 RepID=UPI0033F06209
MDIKLEGIEFSYGRKQVLRNLNWVIRPGVTGLLGENGAGKTTLLSVLIGLLRPKAGTVSLSDSTGSLPRFGFVPQRFSTPPEMRVIDTVSYATWVNGVGRKEADQAALTALEAVNLADRASARARSLSGGQRQRLGLAAGLAHDPDVLVLDEPTVGLDPTQRVRVREVIAALGRSRTVLLSTHVLEDVHHLCERVGVLAGGRIAFDGTVTEVKDAMANATEPDSGLESALERGYRTLLETLGDDR